MTMRRSDRIDVVTDARIHPDIRTAALQIFSALDALSVSAHCLSGWGSDRGVLVIQAGGLDIRFTPPGALGAARAAVCEDDRTLATITLPHPHWLVWALGWLRAGWR